MAISLEEERWVKEIESKRRPENATAAEGRGREGKEREEEKRMTKSIFPSIVKQEEVLREGCVFKQCLFEALVFSSHDINVISVIQNLVSLFALEPIPDLVNSHTSLSGFLLGQSLLWGGEQGERK